MLNESLTSIKLPHQESLMAPTPPVEPEELPKANMAAFTQHNSLYLKY